jgi:hypothetical protein
MLLDPSLKAARAVQLLRTLYFFSLEAQNFESQRDRIFAPKTRVLRTRKRGFLQQACAIVSE